MGKDPAFLFYPGDYLKDTQCLSEPVQVAYDRIMCEHMRNICISQMQLDFFTKRLTNDQKAELLMVLKVVEGGYVIDWVHESVTKRKAYSESRSKNRSKTYDKHMNNICKTYEYHMENANENEIKDIKAIKKIEKVLSIFTIPAVDEVVAYCKERVNGVDGQKFHDFYSCKGWMVGKNKMKDWKAAVRTWEKGDNNAISEDTNVPESLRQYGKGQDTGKFPHKH